MSPMKPALVGAFVLGGVALLVAAVILVAGSRILNRKMAAVTYFEGSVAGLEVGAPVTFRGVRVGSVTRIGIDMNLKDLSARIPVYLDLSPSQVKLTERGPQDPESMFRRMIAAGLEAQLNMQSLLTGQLGVNLDLRPGAKTAYLGGDAAEKHQIPSMPSKLQTIEAQISELPLKELVGNANETLKSVKEMTDQLKPRLGPLVDSVRQTSDAARTTMVSAKAAVGHIDKLAVEGQKQLTDNGVALQGVLASSDRTIGHADAVFQSLNDMTSRDSEIREDLQSATRDLAATASSLRTLTHRVERNPSSLLKKGKAP